MSRASNEQTVAQIGEFGLISAIAQRIGVADPKIVPVGIGDDSAVITNSKSEIVACLDMLSEGVHFRNDWSTGKHVGLKAAAQNFADICAMGATPTSLLVGLAIPSTTTVEWVMDFFEGLLEEAAKVNAHIVGGDVVRSDTITISVTALGEILGDGPILRSGAKVHDVVAYAGKLGYSAAGLLCLNRGFRSPRALVNAHRCPEPPYEMAREALQAHSMIDVSDGLIADLGHIAAASGVQIQLDTDLIKVPADLQEAAAAFGGDAMQWLLFGGEDHAFVATFPDALAVPNDWSIIGHVVPGEPSVLIDGQLHTGHGGHGWDHFAPEAN